jgi:crossover junction endodeoxyribonuclease RuvC
MRILGVDPGLASTGWGVVEAENGRARYLAHGCVETKPKTAHPLRLLHIVTSIRAVLAEWKPQESSIETLFFAKNVSSALPVAEARGAITVALAETGIPVREFSPNAIKLAVSGVASADKNQVQEMVRIILGLDAIPRPDHAADALAAAICAAQTTLSATTLPAL